MSEGPRISEARRLVEVLTAPGNIVLEGNRASVGLLSDLASTLIATDLKAENGTMTVWHLPDSPVTPVAFDPLRSQRKGSPRNGPPGPRLSVLPTGHLVFYGEHGQRILFTDPEGTPLHECEWTRTEAGETRMSRARVQLDCRQWVGIRPEATEQVATLDLPAHPTRQEPTSEALRQMAAQAWGVPLDDMRYFYPDSSFTRDESGRVAVRLKKDGLYLLTDGTFGSAKFVSYMGAIPWARIDLLNVVELYQSTMTGTGGAAFDLIWGLCHDQQLAEGPIPLRYRGLPTFPSEQAYGLFYAFFRPEAPAAEDPYELFMDSQRGYQIAWWLRPDPPWRYFDQARGLCVTVQGGVVQKVTVADDPVAVPYVYIGMRGFASCERTVAVAGGTLQLRDGDQVTKVPIHPEWGSIRETPRTSPPPSYPFGWRAFFQGDPPKVDPVRAWTTLLCFPEGEAPLEEEPTQLFVLEQIYDYLNQLPNLLSRMAKIHRVLIHNFEPVCAGFISPDNRQRRYTILYSRPEWAQKNAQAIWDRAAREKCPEAVRHVQFLPEQAFREAAYGRKYDLLYRWLPYAHYDSPSVCQAVAKEVAQALAPLGLAFLVGPPMLVSLLATHGIRVRRFGGWEDLQWLPAMIEHFRIHPNTRVNSELTVMLGEKGE